MMGQVPKYVHGNIRTDIKCQVGLDIETSPNFVVKFVRNLDVKCKVQMCPCTFASDAKTQKLNHSKLYNYSQWLSIQSL